MTQPDLSPHPGDLCDTCGVARRDHPVTHRGGFMCGFRDRPGGRPWRPNEVRGGAPVGQPRDAGEPPGGVAELC